MADAAQPYPQSGDRTFEELFNELHDELVKLGVPEKKATATASMAAQRAASEMTLPDLPDFPRNPLAGADRTPRRIQERAMRGLEPTAEQDAYLRSIAPVKEARSEALGMIGRELTGIPQIGRAVEAIGEAYQDPSIASVTNAGTQAAMAGFRPLTAAKVLAAGYGASAAKDAGLLDISANAQQPKASKTALPGLTPEQSAEYNDLQTRTRSGGWGTRQEAMQGAQRLKGLQAISDKYVTENADSIRRTEEEGRRLALEREATLAEDKRREFNDAVSRADATLKEIKAKGDSRNFENSAVGELWNKTGVLTPALFAGGAGFATKAFGGSSNKLAAGVGLGTGGFAAQWPLAHDVLFAPVTNPEKAAYEAYSRELPPDHPRKAEWSGYAEKLPTENPVRQKASEDLYDPVKFVERFGIGAGEGALAGLFGAELANAPRRLIQGAGAIKGTFEEAANKAATRAAETLEARNVAEAKARTSSQARGLAGRRDQLREGADPLLTEARGLERNALAGQMDVPFAGSASHPSPTLQEVRPNALATGQLSARAPSASDLPGQYGSPPPLPRREALPSPAERSALDHIREKIGEDVNGRPYWKKAHGRIQAGSPLTYEQREFFGFDVKPATIESPRQATRGRTGVMQTVPEKMSVQIDDLPPLGSRRNRLAGDGE